MAAKTTDDTEAVLERFRALPFDQKTTLIDQLVEIRREEAEEKRADLMRQLALLDEVTGKADASAPNHAGEASGRTRGPVAAKYQSKKQPSVTWAGRGADPKWLKAEMEETGLKKEDFLIKQAAE